MNKKYKAGDLIEVVSSNYLSPEFRAGQVLEVVRTGRAGVCAGPKDRKGNVEHVHAVWFRFPNIRPHSPFKVGDKVKVVGEGYSGVGARQGDVGIVEKVSQSAGEVKVYIRATYDDGSSALRMFYPYELVLAEKDEAVTIETKRAKRVARLLTNGGYGNRLFKVGEVYEPVKDVGPGYVGGAFFRPRPERDPAGDHQQRGLYFYGGDLEWLTMEGGKVVDGTPMVTVTVPLETAEAFVKAYAPSGMLEKSGAPPASRHRAAMRKALAEVVEPEELKQARKMLEEAGYKVSKE